MKKLVSLFFFFLIFSAQGQQRIQEAYDLYQEAFQHYKKNEPGLARSVIDASLAIHETADSRYLSGLIFERDNKSLRAVSEYEAAVRLDPEYREAVFKKALIYLQFGNPEQAITDLSTLINTFDGGHATRSIMFQIDESGSNQNRLLTTNMMEAQLYQYRARAYQNTGDIGRALTDYNMALSIEALPDYFIGRGLLHLKNKNPQLAREDFLHAIEIYSSNHLAWYNLAVIDDKTVLPESLVLGADFAPTLSLLASKEIEKENYEKASEYLDQSILIQPNDVLSLINRGRVRLKLRKYPDARRDFSQAFKLDPKSVESLYLIGNSYYYEKNFKNALAYYQQYLSVDPMNGMIWFNAAMCHFELKNNDEACHHLSMADNYGMVQAAALLRKHCD
ncbi:MAG: tetratricopeptide repeat protein [Bacteroidota bacterium]